MAGRDPFRNYYRVVLLSRNGSRIEDEFSVVPSFNPQAWILRSFPGWQIESIEMINDKH